MMKLGCLLGERGNYFSFEAFETNVGSFGSGAYLDFTLPQYLTGGDPTKYVGSGDTLTHSSQSGLFISVQSSGIDGVIFSYNFASNNDIFNRWYPDVSTHRLSFDFWANQSSGTNTKDFRAYIGTSDSALESISSYTTIDSHTDLQRYTIDEINVTSSDFIQAAFYQINSGSDVGCVSLLLDDLLPTVDTINLYPRWTAQENRELNIQGEMSFTGRYTSTHYGTREIFNLQFEVMDDIEAEIINRWWLNQYELLFTFDSSETAQQYIVRITNQSRPFESLKKPYIDKFTGTLRLEGVSNGGGY